LKCPPQSRKESKPNCLLLEWQPFILEKLRSELRPIKGAREPEISDWREEFTFHRTALFARRGAGMKNQVTTYLVTSFNGNVMKIEH